MATKKKARKGRSKGKGASKGGSKGKGKTKAKAKSHKPKISVRGKKGLDGTPITSGGESGNQE